MDARGAAQRAITRKPAEGKDTLKTYRYLRIGIVAVVVCLIAAIAIERSKVDCFQTSISAYYYTPVRAVFAGGLLAIGFALIVIKGRTPLEDISLNFAGMLAPIVAVAPTLDADQIRACWSIPPQAFPRNKDHTVADWVLANIDNNMHALLFAGALGLALAAFFAIRTGRGRLSTLVRDAPGTVASLAVTTVVLAGTWLLLEHWDDFPELAHGYAAFLMFILLIVAVIGKALEHRGVDSPNYAWVYTVIAIAMPVGGAILNFTELAGGHKVFALEAYEISLFAVFWIVQTIERWSDEPVPATP